MSGSPRVKESDLYVPVRDWLAARGWVIHVEIFDADIVAVRDGRMLAVELKPCLTQDLMNQLHHRAVWADEVIGAIASEPRGRLHALRYYGFGLLQVIDGKVRQRIKPRPQPWQWHRTRAYRLKKLNSRPPAADHEVAGLPGCSALREQRAWRRSQVEVNRG